MKKWAPWLVSLLKTNAVSEAFTFHILRVGHAPVDGCCILRVGRSLADGCCSLRVGHAPADGCCILRVGHAPVDGCCILSVGHAPADGCCAVFFTQRDVVFTDAGQARGATYESIHYPHISTSTVQLCLWVSLNFLL